MQLKRPRQLGLRILRSVVTVGVIALIAWVFNTLDRGSGMTVALASVLTILCAASWWGLPEAVAGAVAATGLLIYYFIPPLHSFKIGDPDDWVDLAAFLATAILGSDLSARARRSAYEAIARQKELEVSNARLEEERRRAEGLLLNILPVEVAHELDLKGLVSPKYFEDVTVMFTDFVGFTTSAEKLAAEELVALLHEYFTVFDEITKRHGLEKMKTVGDSYMCIGGLPVRNPSHPVDAVLAALEMVRYVAERPRNDAPVEWSMRVGIHTGPVVAGVVGTLKFAFDVWGDTVNFSSRMESSGVPNRVNVSERTYTRVKDFFNCEYRGKIMTKDKREVDMYLVQGVLAKLGSQDEFTRRYQIYFQKDPHPISERPASKGGAAKA
ncbi:MAG TPA: adenylate/guanylate cyclase domain-containing protein [Bryobacteraceae bacterium]|jgi:class 3 adenylate cyclase|nr:adenylate/guanylate cyclase domain-containing protein [Bryobacteraceae bacterium]